MFLFNEEYKNCERVETIKGNKKQIEYITPVGNLRLEYVYSPEGDTWFLMKHGVITKEDFKILTYLKQDTIIKPDYERYFQACKYYEDRCLILPLLVPQMKSSFQALLEFWVGTEELIYAVCDYPEIVEETLEAMKEVNRKSVEVSVGANAPAYLSWEDSSTTNVSPSWYGKYIAPELNDWCDIIHENDSLYIQHACGHLKNLMPIIKETRIDAIESISPPPTGDIEIWDAMNALDRKNSISWRH